MSRQPRRARISNIDLLAKYDYIGFRHLVTQGCIFDPELLYKRFPYEIIPYDYDTYFEKISLGYTFEMVTTNCETGKSDYLQECSGNRHRLNEIALASSSLPYVTKIVHIDGVPMLDGGIVDSIPLMRAIATGHNRNVVVCTRNKGWRNTGMDLKIPKFIYKNYPRLRVALSHRIEAYNRQLEMIDEYEERGEIKVLRPIKPVEVGRMEKDIEKLEALYKEGFDIGEDFCKSMTSNDLITK